MVKSSPTDLVRATPQINVEQPDDSTETSRRQRHEEHKAHEEHKEHKEQKPS
jgi:hypothetical protein